MADQTIPSYSMIDYLVSIGWQYVITNRDSQRYLGPCPVGNHANDDTDPKFSIHANGIAFSCFKCGFQGGGLRDLKEKMGHGDDPVARVSSAVAPRPILNTPKPAVVKKSKGYQGATVAQLCKAKGIDYDYATSTLGWKDCTYGRGNTPAVAIPYFDLDGQQIDTRFRVGISDGTRMVSRKGSKALPYGLQNIAQCRAGNYIILQEGETDWATLDAMGYNGLGIPGVNSFKAEWTVHLNGIKTVYVWQESGGTPDRHGRTPGQQMVHRISIWRGEVFVLEAPPEGKDPCELKMNLGEEAFAALLDQMMLDAKPYDAEQVEAAEAATDNKDSITPQARPAAVHRHKPEINLDTVVERLGTPTFLTGSSMERGHGCHWGHHDVNAVSRKYGKPVNLTSLVLKHREEYKAQTPKIEEFPPISSLVVKLLDFCIFLDDPRRITSHDRIENLVVGSLGMVDLSGQPVPAYQAIVDCGRGMNMTCDVHGPAYNGTHKCYLGFDPNCATQASKQVERVKMPYLEGTANYYHVVFETVTQLPDNPDHWGPVFGKQIDSWQKVIGKAGLWKASKDRLYSRSHATYYGIQDGQRVAVTTWKLLLHEIEQGCLDKIVQRIASAMGAIVVDERRYQKGETAALQIVADFMTHFIGIDESISIEDQYKIFLAHYNATRSRHIFQAFGLLRKLIIALPEPEPMLCPEPGCGLRLREVLDPKPSSGKLSGGAKRDGPY
jgi:hypothetical protein